MEIKNGENLKKISMGRIQIPRLSCISNDYSKNPCVYTTNIFNFWNNPEVNFSLIYSSPISSFKYEFHKYQRFGKPLLQASYQKGRIKPLKYST